MIRLHASFGALTKPDSSPSRSDNRSLHAPFRFKPQRPVPAVIAVVVVVVVVVVKRAFIARSSAH